MKLLLNRGVFGDTYTIGKLYVDGEYLCLTLEDKVREDKTKPVEQWKIKGQTAIPALTYNVTVDYSPKYKRDMIHILDVPGYSGIRVHAGNKSADTEGCVLLGMRWKGGDWIADSQKAMKLLMPKLQEALNRGEEVELTIKNTIGEGR